MISAVLSVIITAVGVSSASIVNDLPNDSGMAEVATEDSGEERQRVIDDTEPESNGEDQADSTETVDDFETYPETESPDNETTETELPKKQYATPEYPNNAEDLSLTVNDNDLPRGLAAVIDGVAYAPAVDLCELLANTAVSGGYDNDGVYRISGNGIDISAVVGETYVTSLGRILWCGSGGEVKCFDGSTVILPIEPICRALGLEYEISESHAVISGVPNSKTADEVYDAESLYWLSHIISAESRGEPLEGQIAVGCVVLNRLRGLDYLGSVYDVIFDRKYGIQFSPAYSGSVYNEPTESSVRAAKICLEGYSISDNIIYFINSADVLPEWMSAGCELIVTIGNHDFYA